MCGIAGAISLQAQGNARVSMSEMLRVMKHRGPDGEGIWLSQEGRVVLGHRRLAIIDVSDLGAQPMHFLDRYTIVFNGEIFNYQELRDTYFQDMVFVSQTDTEVLLALFHKFGEKCLELLDGQFAFTIYDRDTERLFCARDRFGEKPFYYAHHEDVFVFASEMKALWAYGVPKQIDEQALYNYLAWGLCEDLEDSSKTFYKHIYQLKAAHQLSFTQDKPIEVKPYWQLEASQSYTNKESEAIDQYKNLFVRSLQRRMISDVPIGSSLSGGLDSSTIVTNMTMLQKNQSQHTFSAVFPGFAKDESKYIQEVISGKNIDAQYVTPNELSMMERIERLLYYQESPVGSASVLIQEQVMHLAHGQGVKVLIDGQGADEVLAGYAYFWDTYFLDLYRKDKKLFSQELQAFRNNGHAVRFGWKEKLHAFFPKLYKNLQNRKFRKYIPSFLDSSFINTYRNISLSNHFRKETLQEELYFATVKHGLETLLRYSDRNSMSHSVEVRMPFLNHELVEFSFTLHDAYKIKNGFSKYILRKTFENILPASISWRKDKIGYEAPQNEWLKTQSGKNLVTKAVQYLTARKYVSQAPVNTDEQWRCIVAYYLLENHYQPEA